LLGSQSVIWSADGPHGSPGKPYEWLSAADLSLAKDYLNNRGALIILGPPASSTDTPFPQDLDFNDNYQSFDATTQVSPPGRLNLDSFTAGDPNGYSITLASMGAVFGGTEKVTAPPAYSLDLEASFPDATGGTSFAAVCTRPNPAGNWATYIGQFTLSGITGLEPAGATKDQLLDNIVAGTIAFQNGS